MKVVVYGTLKSGYGNNRLLASCNKIADVTVQGYRLWNCGFPVAEPSEEDSIKGELWDLADKQDVLQSLDRLESEGRMYNRVDVVAVLPDGTSEATQMYVGHPEYWNFEKYNPYLTICPQNDDGHYVWSR